MISMLTHTVRSLTSSGQTAAGNLESIASQLKHAWALSDIQELRQRLADCLKSVCEEASRQKNDSHAKIQVLSEGLAASQERLSSHGIEPDLDGVTGFAGRTAAEAAIREAAEATASHYLVVAVLSKLQAVNLRFGYAVGDELLCEFAARVAGGLCCDAKFYRWHGPAIVALLQRSEPLHLLQCEVGRLLEPPIMKSLAGGMQNAFITLSPTWVVIPLVPPASHIIERIDIFVGSQNLQEHKD